MTPVRQLVTAPRAGTTGGMMRIWDSVLKTMAVAGLCLAMASAAASAAEQRSGQSASGTQAASSKAATDFSAQQRARRRAPTRIRVHPRYQRLSPNAVRECSATYVQEFRPSGTVIVPRMHCFWREG